MPKGTNQKLKLYYFKKLMVERTDENHPLKRTDIEKMLWDEYEVSVERKCFYRDIEDLITLGVNVESVRVGRDTYYYVKNSEYELAELKILVDAIQASKFIPQKQSSELIEKLANNVSMYQKNELKRQVYVQGRLKNTDEVVNNAVDVIHSGINDNKKIRFKYFNWNTDKQKELRNNGEYYVISPLGLSWTDENYYMIGYDSALGKIKHFRVDKMLKTELTDENREAGTYIKEFNAADYAKKNFGMFGGEEMDVRLEIENHMANVLVDRFGKDISFRRIDENHSWVRVKVAMSRQFLGWIFSLGESVKIIGSEEALEIAKEEIKRLGSMYQ